jgi:hypothetical protein
MTILEAFLLRALPPLAEGLNMDDALNLFILRNESIFFLFL